MTNKSKVINALRNNDVDFALVSTIPKGIIIESERLLPNDLYLVASTNLKSEFDKNDKQLLNNTPLIFREEGSATRTAMEEYLLKRGISPRTKLQLTSNEAVKQAVIAGLGISIMPLIGIKEELETNNLKIVVSKNLPIVTNWTLIWLKEKKLSAVSTAYLEHLKLNKQTIIANHFSWIDSYRKS